MSREQEDIQEEMDDLTQNCKQLREKNSCLEKEISVVKKNENETYSVISKLREEVCFLAFIYFVTLSRRRLINCKPKQCQTLKIYILILIRKVKLWIGEPEHF